MKFTITHARFFGILIGALIFLIVICTKAFAMGMDIIQFGHPVDMEVFYHDLDPSHNDWTEREYQESKERIEGGSGTDRDYRITHEYWNERLATDDRNSDSDRSEGTVQYGSDREMFSGRDS